MNPRAAIVNGHLEQVVDFDYDAVETSPNPSSAPQVELVAAAKLLHHIVTIGATNPRETMLWINVFLFVMGIHPNQAEPGCDIAAGLKVSKPEWFRRVSRMRRILSARGLMLPKIAGQWGESGQKSAANSAISKWQRRGGRPMMVITAANEKLNWIAEYMTRLDFNQLPPLARQELKAKLLPVVKISDKL